MRMRRMSSQAARTTLRCWGSGRARGPEWCGCRGEGQRADARRDEGELAEDGGGEGDGLAAEAEAGLDDLFPGVDVVLILAGEKLAHLEVDAIDVGGEGEDSQENNECDGIGVGGDHLPPRLDVFFLLRVVEGTRPVGLEDGFVFVVDGFFRVIDGFFGGVSVVRSMRVAGRRSSRRRMASRVAISPLSVSWSSPERCRRPWRRRMRTSSRREWP